MHLIKQHIIEVNCSKQRLGHEFRNDLNSVLDSDFYPKLEKLLDAYHTPELLWSIDLLSNCNFRSRCQAMENRFYRSEPTPNRSILKRAYP